MDGQTGIKDYRTLRRIVDSRRSLSEKTKKIKHMRGS